MSISPSKNSSPTVDRTSTGFEVVIGAIFASIIVLFFIVTFLIATYSQRAEAVTRDVSQVAAEVEAAVANDPEATSFEYVPQGEDSQFGTLIVGDAPAVSFKQSTLSVDISISAVDENGAKVANGDPAAVPGEYIIEGYSTKDWGWGGGTADDPITYKSRVGELAVP